MLGVIIKVTTEHQPLVQTKELGLDIEYKLMIKCRRNI
jgi:hypothetical protein